MRSALLGVALVLLAAGCNNHPVEPAPSATAPPQGAGATATETSPQPGRITPEEWLATPAYKKPNPYDLPLEYEIELPELPPQGLMDPAPQHPPDPALGALEETGRQAPSA